MDLLQLALRTYVAALPLTCHLQAGSFPALVSAVLSCLTILGRALMVIVVLIQQATWAAWARRCMQRS